MLTFIRAFDTVLAPSIATVVPETFTTTGLILASETGVGLAY